MSRNRKIKTDFLIIGSGIGGLLCGLKIPEEYSVSLVTKRSLFDSSTSRAQGGVAVVWDPSDSFDNHIKDTIEAGAGLCHPETVEMVIKDAPLKVQELIDLGVPFTKKEAVGKEVHNDYDLGKEGGHSKRRILHAGDFTGLEIQKALIRNVKKRKWLKIYEHHIAIDLITSHKFFHRRLEKNICSGAYVLDIKRGEVLTFLAKVVILATGGAGKVYLYTSNPDIASGDGIAMAYRAGAEVGNLEFVQFHPTCLYHPHAKSFLISEAIRGEGAILTDRGGIPFMEKYHPSGSLAPRDIVARAIDFELKRTGEDCVFLESKHLSPDFIRSRFPNIYRECKRFGIDISKERIPVVPAAHYFCGGVRTDSRGEATVSNLFAVGEVAFTGLHGANRLASNSLLEAMAFADLAVREGKERLKGGDFLEFKVPSWDPGSATDSDEAVVITQNWEEIRRFMTNYMGIVRSDKRLVRAERRIRLLLEEIREYYWDFTITSDLIELRNIAEVASLVIESALKRKESRGLHYNIDYPYRDDLHQKRDTILKKAVA